MIDHFNFQTEFYFDSYCAPLALIYFFCVEPVSTYGVSFYETNVMTLTSNNTMKQHKSNTL